MSLQCGGSARVPFNLPLEVDGIKHTLILGPTRAGKSTLIGAMIQAYTNIPNSRIFVADIGRSSYVLAQLLGADYYDVGTKAAQPLCPLAVMEREGGQQWLRGWFERLFARWPGEMGIGHFELNETILENLMFNVREIIRDGKITLAELRANIHGDGSNGPRDRIRRILQEYTEAEGWGHIFNGRERRKAEAQVTVFEVAELMEMEPRARMPALELIFHNIISQVDGIHPTFIFLDEFWRFLEDETAARVISNALRALGKKNTGIIASTQAIDEVANSPFKAQMLASFRQRIFLPDYTAATTFGRQHYLDIGVSPYETTCIASHVPKRDYYYQSPEGCRWFTLNLGRMGKELVGATGNADVAQARSVFAQCDPSQRIDAWLAARIPTFEPGIFVPDAT